jgi:signal transduction histidine kinase/ActR/RegA family two-component response regulator
VRKTTIVVLAVVIMATLGIARAVDLWWWRAQTLTTAEARAANLSHILAEYVGESFAAGDSALRQLVIHGRHIGGATAHPGDWDPTLVAAKSTLTGVGSISVIDRDGVIRHSTQPLIIGQSRRDADIFRRLRDATTDELAIDTPFLSVREPRQQLIPIGRRLTDAAGQFDGAIVTTFIPAVPQGFFRTVDVGRRGIVWVFHPAGVLMFREPSSGGAIGQSAAANRIFAAAGGQRAGTIRAAVDDNGPFLLSAFSTLQHPPLIVAISLDRDEVLAPWRREAVDSTVVMAMLALLVVATLAVLAAALEREQTARRDAETASALKDQFLMTVSHELRTPLTAIYGWARMLVAGTMNEHQRVSALQTIERNARAQMHIIDDLLDVSRVMGGKLRLDIRPIDLGEAVRDAVETARPAAQAKHIQIDVSIDPAAKRVAADAERLQQIVWNLLSNAVKFTPEGGRVSAAVRQTGRDVTLEIADNGEGIASTFLPHVFDRFRQQDSGTKRRYGGLGLGLAIVKSLVEMHGGSASAASDGEGRGSTFTVRLPASAGAAAAAHTEPPVANPPVAAGAPDARRLDNLHVLVVDDESETRELFRTILEGAGAAVICADSASAALAALRVQWPDVLVADIEMPGEDGFALVAAARTLAAERGTTLVAIAVTAYSRPEDHARSIAAGFAQHLRKPIDPLTFVAALDDLRAAPARSSTAGGRLQ